MKRTRTSFDAKDKVEEDDNPPVPKKAMRASEHGDSSGNWLVQRTMAALDSEKYEEAMSWATKGCTAYGNEVCVAVLERLTAAPWDSWRPDATLQKTQLTKIHNRQVLWMKIAKRMEMDRNIALLICGWISTL